MTAGRRLGQPPVGIDQHRHVRVRIHLYRAQPRCMLRIVLSRILHYYVVSLNPINAFLWEMPWNGERWLQHPN